MCVNSDFLSLVLWGRIDAFLSFLLLTVFSSPLKKTRVPGTAGNSAQTTRGRRNEWHKKEVRRSVVVV